MRAIGRWGEAPIGGDHALLHGRVSARPILNRRRNAFHAASSSAQASTTVSSIGWITKLL
jgi:hypothetical protein